MENKTTITKNKNYNDSTDNYLIYTFTGKTKNSNFYKYYQFVEKPKNNNTWLKPRTVYKTETWIKNYFTEA